MKNINQTLSEGQSNDLDELIMADVRGHLRNYGDWRRLSEVTGVSYTTIENYAYGYTRRPHQHTTTSLMDGMGLGDQLRNAYYSDTPVARAKALGERSPELVRAHAKRTTLSKGYAKMTREAVSAFKKNNPGKK